MVVRASFTELSKWIAYHLKELGCVELCCMPGALYHPVCVCVCVCMCVCACVCDACVCVCVCVCVFGMCMCV